MPGKKSSKKKHSNLIPFLIISKFKIFLVARQLSSSYSLNNSLTFSFHLRGWALENRAAKIRRQSDRSNKNHKIPLQLLLLFFIYSKYEKGFVTSGTPISASRLLKEGLMKMEAEKELYTINDMIKKGPEEVPSADLNLNERLISKSDHLINNFVSILSDEKNNNNLINSIDENEHTEEIIDNILSHLSLDKRSKLIKRKFADRKKRSQDDLRTTRDQLDFGEDIFERKVNTKVSYLECSPMLSGNFPVLN